NRNALPRIAIASPSSASSARGVSEAPRLEAYQIAETPLGLPELTSPLTNRLWKLWQEYRSSVTLCLCMIPLFAPSCTRVLTRVNALRLSSLSHLPGQSS